MKECKKFLYIVAKFLGFFYIMYIARYLGVAGFGVLSFGLTFVGFFGILCDLGLASLTIRDIARDKSQLYISHQRKTRFQRQKFLR